MTNGIAIEIISESLRVIAILGVVIFLWKSGRRRFQPSNRNWNFILAGFALLFFGSLLDTTDNFAELNRFVVVGNTLTSAFLQNVIGYLGGVVFLAVGVLQWVPDQSSGFDCSMDALQESQDLFSKAFHLSPVALSFSNPDDGTYYDVNDAWTKAFGYSHAEAMAKSALKLGFWVNPDDRSVFLGMLENNGLPANGYETMIRSKNGDERNVVAYGEYVEINRQVMLFMIFHDITNRKKAEKALQESEKQYRNLVEGSIQGVYIHRNWDLLFANSAMADIFGYDSAEEVLALDKCDRLLDPDEHVRLRGYMLARQRGEIAPDIYEARGLKKDGSMIWAEFRITSIDWHGEPAMQCVVIDITDRKRVERELTAHRDELQKLVDTATKELKENADELKQALAKEKEFSKLQREFVSMASHEFRTPLAVIDATAQRIKRRSDKGLLAAEEVSERVEKIRAAVRRMTRLMESTLSATRMENGMINIDVQPCNIRKVVRGACQRQTEIAPSHVITCEVAALPETIQADTGLLEQVLTNLLSNAVKYAPDAPDIQVVGHTDDGQVEISVSDRGIGIDTDDLDRIGERYYRARSSTGIAGTGIGLNLARTLVEMHEGAIAIESEIGKGSTFTIQLPIAGPRLPDRKSTVAA